MKTATTRKGKGITAKEEVLYVALELGKAKWRVASTIGPGQKPREVNVGGADRQGLLKEIERAKQRFGLASSARVKVCYEAGREGFWLHRFLVAAGVDNVVVDSSSIEVNRRKRRAKTDRLDVRKLLSMLIRYHWGEEKVWSVVHVPTVEQEDGKQLHRELMGLRKERNRLRNRMEGLLAAQGVIRQCRWKDFAHWVVQVRLWDGQALAGDLCRRLRREWERLELVMRQIKELESEREDRVRTGEGEAIDKARKLMKLRGIGMESSWLFTMEIFAWRKIRNRRELGALTGLVGSPYQSGESMREQGISKAGIRSVRAYAVELAWCWVQLQPQSKLSRWFEERFGKGNGRSRKVGIVALARKLMIALWRYVEQDQVPEGALLKPAA